MSDNPLNQPDDTLSSLSSVIARLDDLEARWTAIENLAESVASQEELYAKMKEYLEAQTTELKQLRCIRTAISFVAVIFVICVAACLYFMLLFKWPTLEGFEGITSMSIVIGSFSSIVVILAALIRGVYRLASDRNKELELPPEFTVMLKAAGVGGG